jgi:hypothetical protein
LDARSNFSLDRYEADEERLAVVDDESKLMRRAGLAGVWRALGRRRREGPDDLLDERRVDA